MQSARNMTIKTTSTSSSVINLVNTIIGAGLLVMPYAFATDGVLPGIFIVVVSGVLSGLGLYFQGLTSKFVAPGKANFFTVCSITYPRLSVIFDVAIFVQCFGVGMSYLVLIGDLMPSIIPIDVSNEKLLWVGLSAIPIVPLCLLRRIDSLKYTSVIALFAIMYMALLVYVQFALALASGGTNLPDELKGDVSLLKPQSFNKVLSTFSIIVLAYSGHQIMYQIINELKDDSIKNITFIVLTTISLSGGLLLSVGLCGYLTFGDTIKGNIILMYPESTPTKLAKLSLVIMVLLSFPLMFFPCRASINNIFEWITNRTHKDESAALLDSEEESSTEGADIPTKRFIVMSLLLLCAAYAASISLKSFELILSLVGATGSTSISFILPGAFGYKLLSANPGPQKAALGLLCFGVCAMVICVYSTLCLQR